MKTRLAAVAVLACLCIGSWASAQEATPPAIEDGVAIGKAAAIGDAWSVKVVEVFDDPSKIDPGATWFTDWLKQNPPPKDQQFFTVRLRIENIGKQAEQPMSALSFALVSDSGFTYDGRTSCGSVPGQLSFMEQLDTGDAVETNLCWIVRSKHVPTLRLEVKPAMTFDDEAIVRFSLSKQAATPTP